MDKKTIITISVVGLVAILLVFALSIGDKESKTEYKLSDDPNTIIANAQKEKNAVKENETKELSEINLEEYINFYNGEEPILVFIARPTCGYCQIAEPIIKHLVYEYDIDMKYLNTDEFSEEDQAKFIQSDEKFNDGFGTPMLVLIGNNKIIDMIDGLSDTAHYIDFFKTNKIIK